MLTELDEDILELLEIDDFDTNAIRRMFIQEEMVEDIEASLDKLLYDGYIERYDGKWRIIQ